MYKVTFDKENIIWNVVNKETNQIQSSWATYAQAATVSIDLNKPKKVNRFDYAA